ncbi:hypothetical protein [Luedemannella helvata]|uniref:Uncharacterized protein n=1 Tax=Luedemannella helvata TaxID=349315 RepID=A0ABN2L407_9ACTN
MTNRYDGVVLRRARVGISEVMGPYPALVVNPGETGTLPWFTRTVVQRIAEDSVRLRAEGATAGDLVEFDGDTVTLTSYDQDEEWPSARIQPNEVGMYGWGAIGWLWDDLEIVGPESFEVAEVVRVDSGSTVTALVQRDPAQRGAVRPYLPADCSGPGAAFPRLPGPFRSRALAGPTTQRRVRRRRTCPGRLSMVFAYWATNGCGQPIDG